MTTYYTVTHTSLTLISNIFNTLNNDGVDFPKETIDLMLKKAIENLERVQQATQDSALAMGLYTDFSITDKDEILYTRYLEVWGEIHLKAQVIELINQEPETIQNNQLYDKLITEQLDLVGDLVSISANLKFLYTGITKNLRAELRKFDD